MAADPYASSLGARFDKDLRRQSKHSIGWTVVRFMSDQFFSFVVFVLLARLLSRADIGAFAIIAIVSEIFRTISTAGLTQIVAREPVLNEEFNDTVYRGNTGFSLIASAVIIALAHPFADFMDAPQIATPLQVLSLVLPLSALGQTHMALRLRQFGHKTTALRSVASGILGGGAAIAAAFAGLGLWALVIQRLATEVVSVILSRASYRWKPGWKFRWPIFKRNLGLNGSLTATQLVFIFTLRLQELVIGNVIGVVAVGIYRTAWRTVELISNGAIRPFTTVAMQTLARVKEDQAELGRAYQWMISKAAVISFPALAGFAVLAPLAVPTVFGPKWAQAGELAQIFAFMVLPFTLNQFASPSLGAVGASRSLLLIAVAQLGLTALFTSFAAPFGLFAVAWAYVARAYLTLPLQIIALKRASGIGLDHTWAAIWQPLLASTVMAGALYVSLPEMGDLIPNPWVRLVLVVMAGTLVYGLTLIAISPLWRALFVRTLKQVRR
ncbi:lipopolysaccharide biosynthesis protein [Rhizorhapis sp.]|uniref:lipopolysaccharide biosynthesis protein n=1 Tax=Rhizorhapis sp. TaxID=1968842 RepID=UPI002B45F1EF|nr:lipopolysaccharide biosynthesis protein [Rhizorhapis sp.]HKR16913.1 lipopolysaccharide biosynthesis protein [Rhizorhapis sp.]HKX36944.1 lipopolysaccharide biosynthesis protein [Rhizorhapis sp.]